MLGVIACALLVSGCGGARQQQRVIYPKGRLFQRSCAAMWPELMRVFDKAGFRLRANDKKGGIASFVWLNARQPEIAGLSGRAADLVIAPQDGLLEKLNLGQGSVDVRVESAIFTTKSLSHGCDVEVSVSYGQGQSSGLFESRLLGEAATVLSKGRRQLAAKKVERGPANEAIGSTDRKPVPAVQTASGITGVANAADSEHTAVYRLPSP